MSVSNADFRIYFCGPALENGQMNVRELAPALMAIGGLLEESNRVLNGERATVSVNVKAFEDGSFGVLFNVDQSMAAHVMSLFTGEPVTAAINIITLLGFTGSGAIGLFKLLKKSKGKHPKKAKQMENGDFQLHFQDGKVLEISKPVLDLYRDLKVRAEVENVVQPLLNPGITGFRFGRNDEEVTVVQQDEVESFNTPEEVAEEVEEQEMTATLSIHSLSFKEDNKWRFSDGTSSFYATILDEQFLEQIKKNQVSFSMGDLLKVQLIKHTKIKGTSLKSEYQVTKVLEHKSAAQQIDLPFE